MERKGGWFGRWLDWTAGRHPGYFMRRLQIVASPETLLLLLLFAVFAKPVMGLADLAANALYPVPQHNWQQLAGNPALLEQVARARDRQGNVEAVVFFIFLVLLFLAAVLIMRLVRKKLKRHSFFANKDYADTESKPPQPREGRP